MNITINEKVLDKYNLTLEEFLVLYLCSKEVDIEGVIQDLIDSGIVNRDLYNNVSAVVSNNTKELITSIIIDSDKAVVNKDSEFNTLAEKLREIYPKGVKPGTTYLWRDSVPIIARKLKTLVTKFGVSFTEQEAIDATKKYVESFGSDRKFMQLLKYFILKTDKTTGEVRSDFLAIIQNPDTQVKEEDWTSSLV